MPCRSGVSTTRRCSTASACRSCSPAGSNASTARVTEARNWLTVCSAPRSSTRSSTARAMSGSRPMTAEASSSACRAVICPARNAASVFRSVLVRISARCTWVAAVAGAMRRTAAISWTDHFSLLGSSREIAANSSICRAASNPACRATPPADRPDRYPTDSRASRTGRRAPNPGVGASSASAATESSGRVSTSTGDGTYPSLLAALPVVHDPILGRGTDNFGLSTDPIRKSFPLPNKVKRHDGGSKW